MVYPSAEASYSCPDSDYMTQSRRNPGVRSNRGVAAGADLLPPQTAAAGGVQASAADLQVRHLKANGMAIKQGKFIKGDSGGGVERDEDAW